MIRYEGVLHKIDMEKATVELTNVRSFGTEGREKTADPPTQFVPASDHVFPHITFRGADIKDISMTESNEKKPAELPPDPAIIASAAAPPPSAGGAGANNPNAGGRAPPGLKKGDGTANGKQPQGSHSQQSSNGRRGQSQQARPVVPAPKFEGEYDMQAANEQLDKDEIEKELADKLGEVKVEDESYNPKSFFDNISCESKAGRQPRRSRNEERANDSETFGSVSVNEVARQHGRNRRGGRRGRGGRGGGRGRGGGERRGFGGNSGAGNDNSGRGRGRGGRSDNRNWRQAPPT